MIRPDVQPRATGDERARARLVLRLLGLLVVAGWMGRFVESVGEFVAKIHWAQLDLSRPLFYLSNIWRIVRDYVASQDFIDWLPDYGPVAVVWGVGLYLAAGGTWPVLGWATREVRRGRLHVVPASREGDRDRRAGDGHA